jgi:hypothetical protein
VKILIYVVFRATLHECLSVSLRFWRSQVEDFRSYFFTGCVLTGQYREVETRMSGADSALLSLSYEEVAALSGGAPMAARFGVARVGGGSRVSPRLAQPLTAPHCRAKAFKKQ